MITDTVPAPLRPAAPGDAAPAPRRRAWTCAEERRLRELYPSADVATLRAAFPGRTPGSISGHASKLGVAARPAVHHARPVAQGRVWTRGEDEAVRRAYAEGGGAVGRLCVTLGLGYRAVRNRATRLGLHTPRLRPPPWTGDEDALLRTGAHLSARSLQRRLAAAGFARTEPAIAGRLAILGLDAEARAAALEDRGVYTPEQVAAMFGACRDTVYNWVEWGWLAATRAGRKRWAIRPKAIRAFVAGHAAHVDLRKVEAGGDKFLLLDILLDGKAS